MSRLSFDELKLIGDVRGFEGSLEDHPTFKRVPEVDPGEANDDILPYQYFDPEGLKNFNAENY